MSKDFFQIKNIMYPRTINSEYIKTYGNLNDELRKLIEVSGYKAPFAKKYFKALRFLEKLKMNCTEHKKIFEQLDEYLYSIKLIGEKNIRVIFAFFNYNNKEIVVLLNCFQEKAKANKKTKESYSTNIKIAYKRIEQLELLDCLNKRI